MVNRFVMKSEHNLFIDCLPYEWRSGTSDGLFLPIYPPRSMRVVLWFLMTSNFFATSTWVLFTDVESMDYTHLTLTPLLASLLPCNFRLYHTPTIPTYYGISIAIPRYISMQLSAVPFIWHALLLSYCFLHDHVVDIVFVARPPS